MLTYPKSHFSEDHISAPGGCCAPKFLHALENDQVLLAHSPPKFFWGVPPKKILDGHYKIGIVLTVVQNFTPVVPRISEISLREREKHVG